MKLSAKQANIAYPNKSSEVLVLEYRDKEIRCDDLVLHRAPARPVLGRCAAGRGKPMQSAIVGRLEGSWAKAGRLKERDKRDGTGHL